MAPTRKQTRKVNKAKASKKSRRVRRQHRLQEAARRPAQRGGANYSLRQGEEFASRHMNQHGGALLTGAPVGDTGMLPDELRMAARVGGLDADLRATQGMSDAGASMPAQHGGRRTNSKKSKAKKSKKSKKSKAKKSKKSKKSRRQSGGARMLDGAPLSESPMLLTPAQAARAGTADFSGAFAR